MSATGRSHCGRFPLGPLRARGWALLRGGLRAAARTRRRCVPLSRWSLLLLFCIVGLGLLFETCVSFSSLTEFCLPPLRGRGTWWGCAGPPLWTSDDRCPLGAAPFQRPSAFGRTVVCDVLFSGCRHSGLLAVDDGPSFSEWRTRGPVGAFARMTRQAPRIAPPFLLRAWLALPGPHERLSWWGPGARPGRTPGALLLVLLVLLLLLGIGRLAPGPRGKAGRARRPKSWLKTPSRRRCFAGIQAHVRQEPTCCVPRRAPEERAGAHGCRLTRP